MNWFYRLWKRLMLLRTRNLTFKMELEGENTISSTALVIDDHVAARLPRLRDLKVRLAQLKTRIVETLFTTDKWGNKDPLAQPAFTADQVSALRKKSRWLSVVVVLFVAGEIGLYYLISENLLGGLEGTVKTVGVWGLSLAFALFVLFGFAHALDTLFNFIDARQLHASKRITKHAYQGALVDLVCGALVFALAFAFLTWAGISRINLIEGSMTFSTGDPALDQKLAKGFEAVGRMALIFTYAMALLLAFLKYGLHKCEHQWEAYKAWSANTREQERIVRDMARIRAEVQAHVETEREKGVQLCHDLQRIYGEQFDPAHKTLHEQFTQERAKPGFKVTRDVLNRFRPIIVADEQLFKTAVLEKASVQALMEALDDDTAPARSSLETLYAGLQKNENTKEVPVPKPLELPASLNGKAHLDNEIEALMKP